jgi:hypothetical protein
MIAATLLRPWTDGRTAHRISLCILPNSRDASLMTRGADRGMIGGLFEMVNAALRTTTAVARGG